MSKLTALFIDAAEENVDALPKRLGDLGVRYDLAREAELTRGDSRALLQVLRRAALRDRPAPADPRGLRADLRPEPEAADALRPARQGDRDARLRRRRALPGLQRVRGREAVRARSDDPPVHAAPGGAARPKEIRSVAGILRDAPYQWHDILEQARRGQLEVGFVHKGLDDLTHKLDVVFNRLVIALIVAGGLIGSSLIGIFAKGGPHLLGLHVISLAGFVMFGVLGVWPMIGVIRSGRL